MENKQITLKDAIEEYRHRAAQRAALATAMMEVEYDMPQARELVALIIEAAADLALSSMLLMMEETDDSTGE